HPDRPGTGRPGDPVHHAPADGHQLPRRRAEAHRSAFVRVRAAGALLYALSGLRRRRQRGREQTLQHRPRPPRPGARGRLPRRRPGPAPAAGLFIYQCGATSRNRLGYDLGLRAMQTDPYYDERWRGYFDMVRQHLGMVDFADLIYARSELYVSDQRRSDPDYEP